MNKIGTKTKKAILKIIDVIVLFIMLIGNTAVLAEEIVESVVTEPKASALVEMSISKYNNFDINETKGMLLQFNLKTGIEYADEQTQGAIKNTTTVVQIPDIDGKLPARVETFDKSTNNAINQATYDNQKGLLQIVTNNNEEDNKLIDDYEIICIYGEEVYAAELEERNIEITAVTQIENYNEEIGIITGDNKLTQSLTENFGELVSTNIATQDIYDGYIKSNKVYGTTYETIYKENMNIFVSYKETGEKLVLNQTNKWQNQDSEDISNIDNIVYKSTAISKQDMLNILGEEGFIKILLQDEEIVINKDTEANEYGIIEITYPENTEALSIEISKTNKEGTIRFENTKTIKSTVIDLLAKKIVTNQTISTESAEIANIEKVTELKSSETQVDVTIDNNTLSSEITNNVVLTATLKNNSNQQNLFKEPVIKITLPQEIEKAVIGEVSVLHSQGLVKGKTSVVEKADGTKELIIPLTEAQQSYLTDGINDGTSVVIPVSLVVNKDIDTTESSFKVSYTNKIISGNTFITEEKTGGDINITLLGASKTENITTEDPGLTEEVDTSVNTNTNTEQKESGLELQAYAQIGEKVLNDGDSIHTSEVIKYVVSVKNTTEETISNVDITCQIPENTVYATVDIGTYFEENYEYIEDATKTECNFTAESLAPGETKVGFYEVVVKDLEEGITQKDISNAITAKEPNAKEVSVTLENKIVNSKLDVFLKSYIGRVEEDSFVYYLDVTNLSDETLTNVAIETSEIQKEIEILDFYEYTDVVVETTMATQEVEEEEEVESKPFGKIEDNKIKGVLPSIEPGKTRTILIETKAGNFDENVTQVLLKMSATAFTNENDIYYSNENRRYAYPEVVNVKMSLDREGEEVEAFEEITYTLEIKNESKTRTNVHVYDYLPEEIEGISLQYDKYIIQENSELPEVEDGLYDDAEQEEQEDEEVAEDLIFDTEDGYGETIYDIEAEANIAYTIETVEKDLTEVSEGEPNIDEYLEIPAGKSVVMTIKAQTTDVLENKEVSNYATVEANKTVTSNIVKFTLLSPYENGQEGEGDLGDDEGDSGKPGDTEIQEPNSISGIVWIDKDEDGKRDDEEQLVRGISVSLYDINTKSIAKDNNGNSKKTITDENGGYLFTDVNNGEYWILFEYDNNNYSLTTYQKNGVAISLNSDVITKKVAINGIEKNVAITDTLKVEDNAISNIDMGLIENSNFDLKLDKYISQIDVQNGKGTKIYSYENTQFAKIEVKSKDIKNTTITVEYKIIVTNEGSTQGYASKIVDYIPEGYTFDSNYNKGWTKESSGNLINTSLSGQIIGAGESKELTLILTKQLTENSTGSVINKAEITENKNIGNLEEENLDNNNSQAELLISIETGILGYTIAIIAVIGILAIILLVAEGTIKPFKNIKIKNTLKMLPLILALGVMLSTEVYGFSVKYQTGGKFKGSNGVWYVCADPGKYLCGVGNHYYRESDGKPTGSKTTSTSTTTSTYKYEKVTSDVNVKELNDSYNLVGPYKMKVTCSGKTIKISKISIKYTKEDGTTGEITSTARIVDSSGNAKSLTLSSGTTYTFYVKVGKVVTKINSLRVYATINDAKKTVTTTKQKYIYPCYKVSGTHHNGRKQTIRPTPSQIQRMKTYSNKTKTSTSYSDITKYLSWGVEEIPRDEYGDLRITKTDVTTGAKLKNVEFTLQMISGSENGNDDCYVTVDTSGNAVYKDDEVALKTNSNGIISIKNLEVGEYKLIETANPNKGYEEVPKVIKSSLTIKANTTVKVSVTNKREYIDLEGIAWEDIGEQNKISSGNGFYKEGTSDINDKNLKNVTVNLIDNETKEVVDSTETDANGKYIFKDVKIDDLDKLYIEFVYNGMSYENVQPGKDKGNGNKATEGTSRTDFNNNYVTIKKGVAVAADNHEIGLQYSTSDYTSKLIYGGKTDINYDDMEGENTDTDQEENVQEDQETGGELEYGYAGQKYPINGVYQQYMISANTYNTYGGCLNKIMTADYIRNNGETKIYNINLGLKEREQPDLAVSKELLAAKVSVNGKEHYYRYEDRNIVLNINESSYEMNPQVKFGIERGKFSYTRALYASDIYTLKDESGVSDENKLSVKVIYKIGIKNMSTNLKAVVNQLQDFYDTKYGNIVAVGTGYVEDTNNQQYYVTSGVNYSEQENSGYSEYKKILISPNLQLEKQMEGTIFVELEVNPGNIVDILDKGVDVKLDNMAEITSYSIKDTNGNVYAGIDVDSQPGNLDINNIKTYEDDTDKAPGLLLILQEEQRLTNGIVFEDLDANDLQKQNTLTNQIREGNGQYDSGEPGVPGVTVRLHDSATGEIAKSYDESRKQWKNAETTTNADGTYNISGYLPGEYYIEYEWGDINYKVQDYKATIVDENIYKARQDDKLWYKQNSDTRLSDAIDNYELRTAIDEQIKTITYGVKEKINSSYLPETPDADKLYNKMKSTTADFVVNLENNTNITNIDFGIIQRAKQELTLMKMVESAKVILANGTVLIDARINEETGKLEDDVQHGVYLPEAGDSKAQFKIEIDNEIIYGATLEVTYKIKVINTSELDYINERYYMFGSKTGNTTNLVELSANTVIDYLDSTVLTEEEQIRDFKLLSEEEKENLRNPSSGKLEEQLLANSNEMKEQLDDSTAMTTEKLSMFLKPQESTEVKLSGNKIVANNNEDVLENTAEIIEVEKTGGSSLTTIPGNYIVVDEATYEVDNANSPSVTIMPPTGTKTDMIAYTILAISSLGILLIGIILIKKYVLK